MKYLRKIVYLVIAVVLFAAVIIGAGVILAVKNVNVTLISYTYENDEDGARAQIAEFKESVLSNVRGSVLLFVGEDSVTSAIDGSGYVLESFEKVYPCTVNITLRERRETFAVKNADGSYGVYYEDGGFCANKEVNENTVDGAPNLVLEGAETAEDLSLLVGVCNNFKEAFSSLRGIAEKAVLTKAHTQTEKDKVTFYLHSGLKIEVLDYAELGFEKLKAGNAKYLSLSGEERLGGTLYCSSSQGTATAVYSK